MAHVYPQALQLVLKGWTILPVPHGWTEPRFDWAGYRTRRPSDTELRAWLAMDVGFGVVLGKISGNLAALELTAPGAYLAWKAANPELAANLPTLRAGGVDVVFFRTENPPPNGSIVLEGAPGIAGQILGEGRFLPLPPTRSKVGENPRWIVGVEGELPILDPARMGLLLAHAETAAREDLFKVRRGQREEARRKRLEEWRRTAGAEAERYGSLFQSTPDSFDSREDDFDWVVQDFLPESYLAILAGDSKSGKSCLATALAVAVAGGNPFLGLPTRKSAVLWIAYEESREERAIAIRPHGRTPEELYVTHQRIPIDQPEGLDALRWWVRQTGARLIVVDPLYAATGASISDGQSARQSLTGLKELCRTESCAALVLHHLNKRDHLGFGRGRIAASHQLLAVASMDILMSVRESGIGDLGGVGCWVFGSGAGDGIGVLGADGAGPDPSPLTPLPGQTTGARGTGRLITLQCSGRGTFANEVWRIASTGPADYRLIGKGLELEASGRDDLILAPLRASDRPLSAEELAKAAGMHLKTLQNRVRNLVKEGLVEVADVVGHVYLYRTRR